MSNPNDIIINLQVNNLNQLNALSNGLRQVNATLAGNAKAVRNLDANQKALNKAIGYGSDGVNHHAKSLSALIANQSALSNEIRRSSTDLKNITKTQYFATSSTKTATAQLKQYNTALKGIKAKALVSDLRSLAFEMRRTGKDTQWTGRQLITGLTLPMLAFGRIALSTFAAVDKELTMIEKIVENISSTAEKAYMKMGVSAETANAAQKKHAEENMQRYKRLEQSFTDLSTTYAANKALVISLGADFAQLGLQANETISSLTEAVLMAEKLGDVDIGQAKDFVQTVYFQAIKALDYNAKAHDDVKSAVERENAALAIVNGTLARFNLIENTTVLSLRDIAKALPEAGAAATQFGLSMSETMALLAPMKAAGFDVSSSANAIKVSLQRLNDPTNESREMIEKLNNVLGFDFSQATHIGINSIDFLAQAFNKVQNSAAGAEGAMEFMTQLFVLRQGPRMAESIADIAKLNDDITKINQGAGVGIDESLKKVIDLANGVERAQGSVVPLINSFSDLGNIARISTMNISDDVTKNVIDIIENGKTVTKTVTQADVELAKQIRQQIGDEVLAQRAQGDDLIASIKTQTGKVMVAQLVGVGTAAELAQQEVDIALKSVSSSLTRIKVNFQLIAAELIKGFRPVIEFIDKAMQKIAEGFRNMSPGVKIAISAAVAGLAALGPLIYAFGLAKSAIGVLAQGLLRFVPGISNLTAASIAASPALMNLSSPVVMVGNAMTTSASRTALFTARLASMNGPIGAAARQIGYMTGMLKREATAAKEVQAAVTALNITRGTGVGLGAGNVTGLPIMTRPVIDDAMRASIASQAGIMGPQVMSGKFDALYLKNLARSQALGLPSTPFSGPIDTAIDDAMMQRHLARGGQLTTSGKFRRFGGNLPMTAGMMQQQRGATQAAMRRAARLGLDQSIVNMMPVSPGYDPIAEQATMKKFGTTRTRMFRQAVDRRFVRGVGKSLIYDTAASSVPGAPVAQANYKMASLFKQKSGKFAGDYYRSVVLTPNQERRIVEGGILGALQKTKLRLTPTYEAMKRNAIRGAKAVKNAVVNGFQAMVPAIKRAGNAIGLAMDKFMLGFQGLFTKGQTLTAIKNGIFNMIGMIGNGFKQMALTAKAGLVKVGIAIKNSKLGQAFHLLFTDPRTALTNFVTIIKTRTTQAVNILKARILQMKALNAKFAATNIGGKVARVTNFALEITGYKAIKKAIYEAQFAALQYQTTQAAFGGKQNAFVMMAHSVKAFTMSLLKSMNIMKLVKIVFMSMGITAVILAISAAVIYLINGFRTMGKGGDDIKKKFSTAFNILAQVVKMVIKPIKDAIHTVLTLMTGASDAKSQFSILGDILMKVANGIKDFFEKYIVPALEFVLIGAVNIIRGVTKFIQGLINIFKGDWKKGLGQMAQGIALFANVILKIIVKIATTWIKIMAGLYKGIIKGIAGVASGIIKLFGDAIKWVAKQFANLFDKSIGAVGRFLGLDSVVKGIKSGIEGVGSLVDGALNLGAKGINALAGVLGKAIDSGASFAIKAVEKLGSWGQSMLDKIIESTKSLMDSTGKNLVEDANDFGTEYADAFTDPIAAGLDNLIDEAAGELKKFLDDLKQRFVDLVLGQVAEKVQDVVEGLNQALQDQKDAALAVYDTQIETLDKLAKAEESLTKEKEYQTERRKMIDERALQVLNYQRERALAIYEGRIDDARVLALQDRKNSIEHTDGLAKIDESRRKDLAQENLEALKEAIGAAKEEAGKFFDEQIKGFEDAAKKITQFPPQTIEEYRSMLEQLNTAASGVAQENSEIFEDMLNSMADNIALPNEAVGVFATSLDQLIITAQAKYGLTDASNENSVVGATVAMLAGIEGQMIGSQESISSAFAGIVDDVFNIASGFSNIGESIFLPAMESIAATLEENNPFTVFEEAIRFANTTLLREITGTVGAVGSMVDGLAGRIDGLILRLSVANFLKSQAENATPDAGGDIGDIGDIGGAAGAVPARAAPSSETYNAIYRQVQANFEKNKTSETLKRLNAQEKEALIRRATSYILDFSLNQMGRTASQKHASATLALNRLKERGDNGLAGLFQVHFGLKRYGGKIPRFGNGGFVVPGFTSQGIPGMLHGGEYVVNADAVRNIGYATLDSLNKMRFATPQPKSAQYSGGSSSTTTTNIYVENFIGEDEWFNSMLKQYNMNVLPAKQKSAGMENRVVTTYSGLSRGM